MGRAPRRAAKYALRRFLLHAASLPSRQALNAAALRQTGPRRCRRACRGGCAGAASAAAAPARGIAEAALPEGEADLLWSNMVLHHQAAPQASMQRRLRLLAVDGILMFSTLGPGSLESLRRLYSARRWPARMRRSSTCTTSATCSCKRASPTR
ncbi:MAG: hypothetical protein U1F67_06425 [Rubrivivax sp.]